MVKKLFKDYFIFYLRVFLSYTIPKKKGYLVFKPTHYGNKFSGNTKALLLYIYKNHSEIKITLVSPYPKVIEEALQMNLPLKSGFFARLWVELRAEHIIIETHTMDLRQGNFSLIQLWHGVGFKNVGLLHDHTSKVEMKQLRKLYEKFKLVTTTSQSDQQKQNKSFGVETTKITGYPKNDVFFGDADYFKRLKKKYNLQDYDRIITYAPTFRDSKTQEAFSKKFWDKLQSWLAETNTLYVVKKHPMDELLKIPNSYNNIKDLSQEIDDVQELLLITDVLITDYSSIATDFALTERPIIIYAYDLDDYIQSCRSMYYDLEEILPKPYLKNEEELLRVLEDDQWFERSDVRQSYKKFRDTFHHYLDGNSSKRVTEKIIKL